MQNNLEQLERYENKLKAEDNFTNLWQYQDALKRIYDEDGFVYLYLDATEEELANEALTHGEYDVTGDDELMERVLNFNNNEKDSKALGVFATGDLLDAQEYSYNLALPQRLRDLVRYTVEQGLGGWLAAPDTEHRTLLPLEMIREMTDDGYKWFSLGCVNNTFDVDVNMANDCYVLLNYWDYDFHYRTQGDIRRSCVLRTSLCEAGKLHAALTKASGKEAFMTALMHTCGVQEKQQDRSRTSLHGLSLLEFLGENQIVYSQSSRVQFCRGQVKFTGGCYKQLARILARFTANDEDELLFEPLADKELNKVRIICTKDEGEKEYRMEVEYFEGREKKGFAVEEMTLTRTFEVLHELLWGGENEEKEKDSDSAADELTA